MTTILNKENDGDLFLILAAQAEMPSGDGGFPNAPVSRSDITAARKRLESKFSQQEIPQALQLACDKRDGKPLRAF